MYSIENYNEIIGLIENCVEDILSDVSFIDSEDELFRDLSFRLSIFALEVLSKYSR